MFSRYQFIGNTDRKFQYLLFLDSESSLNNLVKCCSQISSCSTISFFKLWTKAHRMFNSYYQSNKGHANTKLKETNWNTVCTKDVNETTESWQNILFINVCKLIFTNNTAAKTSAEQSYIPTSKSLCKH